MAQTRNKNGKFGKKDVYKCPNCGNTKYIFVHSADGKVLESQQRCSECGHVLTSE